MSDPIPASPIPDDRPPGFGTDRGFGRLGPRRLLVIMTSNQSAVWSAGGYIIWGRQPSFNWPAWSPTIWQGWLGSNVIEFGLSYNSMETNTATLTLTATRNGDLPVYAWQNSFPNYVWGTNLRFLGVGFNGAAGLGYIRFIPDWVDLTVMWPTATILDKFP